MRTVKEFLETIQEYINEDVIIESDVLHVKDEDGNLKEIEGFFIGKDQKLFIK